MLSEILSSDPAPRPAVLGRHPAADPHHHPAPERPLHSDLHPGGIELNAATSRRRSGNGQHDAGDLCCRIQSSPIRTCVAWVRLSKSLIDCSFIKDRSMICLELCIKHVCTKSTCTHLFKVLDPSKMLNLNVFFITMNYSTSSLDLQRSRIFQNKVVSEYAANTWLKVWSLPIRQQCPL